MRSIEFVLILAAFTTASSAKQPTTPAAAKPAAHVQSGPADEAGRQKLHESAMKFVEAADARRRLAQSLDKLLEDGKQSMMHTNPGLDPRFGEEWVKRMRTRVSLDQIVVATAQVYEKYFSSDELEELAQGQLALKKGEIHTLPPGLAEKLKTNSPFIQRDINTQTTIIGGRLGSEVGKEIEKEHPEWIKPAPAPAPTAKK
ncbi:MAG TPA: hypothetical protein VGL00_16795 [Terracidiphilus sp.]|jgi:hypothetical protein